MTIALLFGSLAILLILNCPVGIALGVSTMLATVFGHTSLSLITMTQQLVTSCDSFPILAIPMFILAGDLMSAGGVSSRLLHVCNLIFGRIRGGLAIVTVLVCMFFAAVSGSGPATVAAIGTMVIPEMIRQGYSKSFTLALIATAGSIGVIIPPSIPMVIFGVATGTSVTSMFKAGIVPGLLIGFSLIVYCYFHSKKFNIKCDSNKPSASEILNAVWTAKWALINPVLILGGIYTGVFTPTEAASVATVYAFICGAFLHRELTFKSFIKSVSTSVSTTATTMVILGCASAFIKIITVQQVPESITAGILSVTDNKIILLILINILLLVVGCFMDTTPAILVLAPILMPVAASIGVDPVHFGIIMVVNLAIGFCTPPLGINLFVASRISNESMEIILQGIFKFIFIMIADLALITFIPQIAMFIPNLGK